MNKDNNVEQDENLNVIEGDEICCICTTNIIINEEIGTPNLCIHNFHVKCIKRWTEGRYHPTCPLDRQRIKVINVRNELNGSVIKVIQVKGRVKFFKCFMKYANYKMQMDDRRFTSIYDVFMNCHSVASDFRNIIIDLYENIDKYSITLVDAHNIELSQDHIIEFLSLVIEIYSNILQIL